MRRSSLRRRDHIKPLIQNKTWDKTTTSTRPVNTICADGSYLLWHKQNTQIATVAKNRRRADGINESLVHSSFPPSLFITPLALSLHPPPSSPTYPFLHRLVARDEIHSGKLYVSSSCSPTCIPTLSTLAFLVRSCHLFSSFFIFFFFFLYILFIYTPLLAPFLI